MTLILAIRCRDGLVLASDGQATATRAGQPTRAEAKKLYDIDGKVAWGAAGAQGMSQTLEQQLLPVANQLGDAPGVVRQHLVNAVNPIQQLARSQFVPHQGATEPLLDSIFCWCRDTAYYILEIPRDGAAHQFHDEYCAIGSGDIFAAFAMASVAHLRTKELDLEQAKMVAFKAVSDAIAVAAFGLGPPIQMYTVTPADGAVPVARDEIEGGIKDSVSGWMEKIRDGLGPLTPTAESEDDPGLDLEAADGGSG